MELDPIQILVLIGINIFGVYALYKISQIVYWFIKDRRSKDHL